MSEVSEFEKMMMAETMIMACEKRQHIPKLQMPDWYEGDPICLCEMLKEGYLHDDPVYWERIARTF